MENLLNNRFIKPLLFLYQEKGGVVAVEFAFIAPVYLMMTLVMIDFGFLVNQIVLVDSAATEVTRQVYTRKVRDGDVGIDDLKDIVCDRVGFFVSDCTDSLTVELVPIKSMDDVPDTDAVCVDNPADIAPVVTFKPGERNEVMFLRICLTTNVVVPLLAKAVGLADSDGKFRIESSAVFMNEPY